jgi:hypothetical protein
MSYQTRRTPRVSTVRHTAQAFPLALLLGMVVACTSSSPPPPAGDALAKIRLDLSQLNEEGLYGSPNGLRALSYAFCVPARDELADEVRSIDPSLWCARSSPGRIGCGAEQFLCVGSTGQPNFRLTLTNLAQLDYVTHIVLSHDE